MTQSKHESLHQCITSNREAQPHFIRKAVQLGKVTQHLPSLLISGDGVFYLFMVPFGSKCIRGGMSKYERENKATQLNTKYQERRHALQLGSLPNSPKLTR